MLPGSAAGGEPARPLPPGRRGRWPAPVRRSSRC